MGQDLYVNFESFNSGDSIASEAAMAQMSKTNGNAVTFVMHATSSKHTIKTASAVGLITPITVAGSSYTNSSVTKEWEASADNGVNTNYLGWKFAASRKVSYALEFTLTNFLNNFNFHNPFALEGSGLGNYSTFSVQDFSPITGQAETNSDVGNAINLQTNVRYWITGLWDSVNGKTIIDIYNRTNMVLVGRTTGALVNNDVVNEFDVGVYDAHIKTTGNKYRYGQIILYTNGTVWPIWPGNNLQSQTNSSVTAMTAAITAASDGDTIIIPATNQTWTSGVTVNKNRLRITSVLNDRWGSNKSAITISGAVTDPNAAMVVSGYMNVLTNFMIKGAGVVEEADGISNTGQSNVYAFIHMENLNVPYSSHESCLVTFFNNINNDYCLARDNRTVTYYNNNVPLSKTSLKHAVYERGHAAWNSSKLDGGSEAGFSSQVGAAWIIRHNDFDLEDAAVNPAPGFDAHGETPGLIVPILSGLLTSNRLNRTTAWNGKFIDVRSPNVWVISNIVTGVDVLDGVYIRNEEAPYPIANCYITGNFDGASGNVAMTVQDDGTATAGVDYFLTLPPDESTIDFPHPWWSAIVAGTWPNSAPTPDLVSSIGPPKIRGLILVK